MLRIGETGLTFSCIVRLAGCVLSGRETHVVACSAILYDASEMFSAILLGA